MLRSRRQFRYGCLGLLWFALVALLLYAFIQDYISLLVAIVIAVVGLLIIGGLGGAMDRGARELGAERAARTRAKRQ